MGIPHCQISVKYMFEKGNIRCTSAIFSINNILHFNIKTGEEITLYDQLHHGIVLNCAHNVNTNAAV